MDPIQTLDPIWWISAVDLPALGGLFWLIWRTRRDADQQLETARKLGDAGDTRLRESIADFKLEVAKSYASLANLSDVERRLVAHLLRIEAKLDQHVLAPAGDRA